MVILFGVIAFVIVACYAWTHRGVRHCRWRAERSGNRGSLRKYRCVTCGAEAFTATAGPPRDCRRDLAPPSL